MIRNISSVVLAAFVVLICARAACARQATPQPSPPSSSASLEKLKKLPRPQPLGKGVTLRRDPASGELHSLPADSPAPGVDGAIQSKVTLVQIACTVTAPDGTQVRGLTQSNFHVFEDGTRQEIASFDASATPASIALVLDASPSIYRELGEMRGAARSLAANLSPADEISVVSFSEDAHLLLPFSTNRALLDRALDSKNLARVEDSSSSNIYQSLFLAARSLFQGITGRKAIVLLTDGQDSGLGLSWDPQSASPHPEDGPGAAQRLSFDDVARELGADGIALFIVSTEPRPRAMTTAWLATHQGEMLVTSAAQKLNMPNYTLYLAEMSRRVGGQLYFLREIGNLNEIYRRIAETISAEYTLGYYPSAGTSRPGWRSLHVELSNNANVPAGSRVTHRGSYYVSAFQ